MIYMFQGCPIGIAKNPEISGCSRKKFTRSARNPTSLESAMCRGGGGVVVAEPSKTKSVDSSTNHVFVRKNPRVSRGQWGQGVGGGGSSRTE